jgi:hypothetical protein
MKKMITNAVALGAFLSFSVYGADTVYIGSSFNEVQGILGNEQPQVKSQQQADELAVYQENRLPFYPVTASSVFGPGADLVKDAQRTVNEDFDYFEYLPKKLHPNGVCVSGTWEITQPSDFSGLFRQGTRSLFIGRISVAMGEVRKGEKRGFGFAGKIFPTRIESEVIKTANFFTVDVLLGTDINRFLETSLTNEPNIGFSFSLLSLFLKIGSALKEADEAPGFRPISPIAKMSEVGKVKSPKWMRLSASSETLKNDEGDFRNEVLLALFENKNLNFNIEVSDKTGHRNKSGWNQLGKINIDHAIVGYGCDRRLHFAHPKVKL